jgi:uncharacterized membrane protein
MKKPGAMMIAIAAMMIAVTAVFTLLIRIPVPATQGYINFSDVAVYFAAATFGPWVGLVAGGLGAALADVLGGYAQFAPLTLLAHGLQGLLAGLMARNARPSTLILAWLAGTVAMVGMYLLGEGFVLTGWGPALVEAPFNLLQNVVGGLVGIPLYYAVRKAYPPVTRLGRGETWREE